MKVTMTAVASHSTHEPNGRQVWHEAGDTYDVDASDVDNLVALGFAVTATADTKPPAAAVPAPPAAAPEPVVTRKATKK
jgi:hypothetical protein